MGIVVDADRGAPDTGDSLGPMVVGLVHLSVALLDMIGLEHNGAGFLVQFPVQPACVADHVAKLVTAPQGGVGGGAVHALERAFAAHAVGAHVRALWWWGVRVRYFVSVL